MPLLRVPLDPGPTIASLVLHAVPGVEEVTTDGPDRGTARRLVRVEGRDAPVTLEARLSPDAVEVHGDAPDEELARLARRWFGLDDDLAAVAGALDGDPLVGPLVRARPRLRILGHLDGFEAAVQTVLGQQVSLAAARVFTGRVAAAYGAPGPDGLLVFPGAERLAAVDPVELQATVRVPHARARTVVALAAALSDAEPLAPGADLDDARRRLLAVPGIGPWTVEYLALRVLADRDAVPVGDLVLRRGLGVEAREVLAATQGWRPWRAFGVQHVWTSAAYLKAGRTAISSGDVGDDG
ncbi:DNA-3-methyladenine glycosylase family protein [Cellulomonas massiliensis]|uniref:DNA-3-methyladenine glycosylase family protein n=1 Tax=Cellulomonas massiliensis TaxID=1465811 RepID=UPI000369C784|nr:AlkA N-terminal domain-containing protein [Cellulomonas massiliensis]